MKEIAKDDLENFDLSNWKAGSGSTEMGKTVDKISLGRI